MTITPRNKPAKTTTSSAAPGDVAPSFEDSMRRLGQIVVALESGELNLEESLAQFEEGVRLARASQSRLDAAEARMLGMLPPTLLTELTSVSSAAGAIPAGSRAAYRATLTRR